VGEKGRVFVAALLVATLAGLAWLVLRPGQNEPAYQGKSLNYWLRCDYSLGSTEKQMAESAIRHIGSNAVPTLLRMFQARDSALKLKLTACTRRHGFGFRIATADERRAQAIQAFGVLRDEAAGAVPALMQIYQQDSSLSYQFAVIQALGKIGPAAKPAIPWLIQRATSVTNSSPVRQMAIMALGEIRCEPELVVTALTRLLGEPNSAARIRAVVALGEFGSDARCATSALFELVENEKADDIARMAAVAALRKIDPEAAALKKAELDSIFNSIDARMK
jgi:hypothetical protein